MTRRHPSVVLAVSTAAFFSVMVARLVIGPLVPAITADFGISNAAIGLALTGMWFAYASTQFPGGVLGDRFGERRVVVTSLGLTAGAGGLLAVTPSFPAFVVVAVLLGLATGMYYPAATALLTRRIESFGRAIGVHIMGSPAAGFAAPFIATAFVVRGGWRPAVATAAAAAAVVFVAVLLLVDATPPTRPGLSLRDELAPGAAARVLTRPPIAFTAGLAVLGSFTFQATTSFLPAFLVANHGLTQATAGALFAVFFVLLGVVNPVTGTLSDRFGRDRVTALVLGVAAAGYAVLVLGSGLWALGAGVVLAGVGSTWAAAVQPRFMDHLGDDERGAGFGLVRTVYMGLGAPGSVIVGAVADGVGWPAAFGLLAVVMGIGALAVLAVRLAPVDL